MAESKAASSWLQHLEHWRLGLVDSETARVWSMAPSGEQCADTRIQSNFVQLGLDHVGLRLKGQELPSVIRFLARSNFGQFAVRQIDEHYSIVIVRHPSRHNRVALLELWAGGISIYSMWRRIGTIDKTCAPTEAVFQMIVEHALRDSMDTPHEVRKDFIDPVDPKVRRRPTPESHQIHPPDAIDRIMQYLQTVF